MTTKTKAKSKQCCPKCGSSDFIKTYEPAYQEYPGAGVQGGYYYLCCNSCDYEDTQDADLSGFNFRENRRGW